MPRVEQVQRKALEEFRERNRAAVKRKKQSNKRQWGEAAITFVCLFFLLSLLFLQIAKKLTPKIDTSIGNNVTTETEQTEVKELIDDRLKLIQYDDAMAAEELRRQKEQEIFNEALDEKVVLPKSKSQIAENYTEQAEEENLNEKVQDVIARRLTDIKTLDSMGNNNISTNKNITQTASVTKPTNTTNETNENLDKRISNIKSSDIQLTPSNNYKVFVGQYQTAEQAQLAKSIIRETALGQNAFVKLVDNIYTIQVGSYSTAEQAKTVAQELTTKSFPARVYFEKPQQTTNGEKTIF